jgi:hypothetical protein
MCWGLEPSLVNPNGYRPVELRDLKEGDFFFRKPTAKYEFIRNHYNRPDQSSWYAPKHANFSCTNPITGSEVFLKPSTIVWID